MAAVTKVGTPSLATPNPADNCRLGPFEPNEDIAAGDACYIMSTGKIAKSTGAAANAARLVDGFAVESITLASRQPVTLYTNVTLNYATGLTPGARLYLSDSVAGGLDTAASTHVTTPIAKVLPDGKRIRVWDFNSPDLIV